MVSLFPFVCPVLLFPLYFSWSLSYIETFVVLELTLLGSRISFLALLTFLIIKRLSSSLISYLRFQEKLPTGIIGSLWAGGVLLTVVRTCLPSTRLHLPFGSLNVECLGISVQLSRIRKLQIFNNYHLHGTAESDWLQYPIHFVTPPFLILGDFNAHHSFWGASKDSPFRNTIADLIIVS